MMNSLLLYLAQVSACLLAFYGFYHLVLRAETCFQFNRGFLLVSLALSVLLPLVSLPDWPFTFSYFYPSGQAATVMVETSLMYGTPVYAQPQNAATPFDWELLIWIGYSLGFIFFACRFIRQLLLIRHYIQQYQNNCIDQQSFKLVLLQGQLPTFSFLNYLFLDTSQLTSEKEKEKILLHETVHISQKHTWDLLYLELFCLVLWFNPILYLYKKALTQTHEFIADAEVIRTTNPEEYATLLVDQVFRQMNFPIGHFFNQSLTVKRMKMIRKNHLRPNRFKQFLALPLTALLLCLVSAENTTIAGHTADPQPGLQHNAGTPILPDDKQQVSRLASTLAQTPKLQQSQAVYQAPQFPGGKSALKKYLAQNLRYPLEALNNELTGHVLIQLTIDAQGRASNFKTLLADNPYLEQEAIRVLKAMPDWQPATNKKQAEAALLAFPFSFGLNSNKPLPPMKLPAGKTRYVLQDGITVIGYSKFINDKTVLQKSSTPSASYPRDNKVFSVVDQPAAFPGGMDAMNAFIRENLRFPAQAREAKKEGLVVMTFVVDRNGKVTDPKVVKSLGYGTDEEALRIVNLFPDFEPAKKDGQPIDYQLTLPVRFSLSQASKNK